MKEIEKSESFCCGKNHFTHNGIKVFEMLSLLKYWDDFAVMKHLSKEAEKRKSDFNVHISNIFNICVQVFFALIWNQRSWQTSRAYGSRKQVVSRKKEPTILFYGSIKKMFFLGIFPEPVEPTPDPHHSVHLGIKMWILVKFRDKQVNFMAKNDGHQNLT